jgi:hypothetical protein
MMINDDGTNTFPQFQYGEVSYIALNRKEEVGKSAKAGISIPDL